MLVPVTLFSPVRGPIKARARLNSKVVPVRPRNLVLGGKWGPGGGQVGSAASAPSPRTSCRRGPSWFTPVERDPPSLALLRSLPGIRHKSACLLNKDEEDRSGCDLNFVTGALCARTVALSVGLVRVAVQTCAGLCPSLTALCEEQSPSCIDRWDFPRVSAFSGDREQLHMCCTRSHALSCCLSLGGVCDVTAGKLEEQSRR